MTKNLSIIIYFFIFFIAINASDIPKEEDTIPKLVTWDRDFLTVGNKKINFLTYSDYLDPSNSGKNFVLSNKYKNKIYLDLSRILYQPDFYIDYKMFFNELEAIKPSFKIESAFDFSLLKTENRKTITLKDLHAIIESLTKKGVIKNPDSLEKYFSQELIMYKDINDIFEFLRTYVIEILQTIFKNLDRLLVLPDKDFNYHDLVNELEGEIFKRLKININEKLFEKFLQYGKDLKTQDVEFFKSLEKKEYLSEYKKKKRKELLKNIYNEKEKILDYVRRSYPFYEKETLNAFKIYIPLILSIPDAQLQNIKQNNEQRLEEIKSIKNQSNIPFSEYDLEIQKIEKNLHCVEDIKDFTQKLKKFSSEKKSLNKIIKEKIYNFIKEEEVLEIIIKTFFKKSKVFIDMTNTRLHEWRLKNRPGVNILKNNILLLKNFIEQENVSFMSKDFLFTYKKICLELGNKVYNFFEDIFKEKITPQKIADFIENSLSMLAIQTFLFPYKLYCNHKDFSSINHNEKLVAWGFDDFNEEEEMAPILTEYYNDGTAYISVLHNMNTIEDFTSELNLYKKGIKYIQYLLYHVIQSIDESEEAPVLLVIKTPSNVQYNHYNGMHQNLKFADRLREIFMAEVVEACYFYDKWPKFLDTVIIQDTNAFLKKDYIKNFLKDINYIFQKEKELTKETGRPPVIFSSLKTISKKEHEGRFPPETLLQKISGKINSLFN